MAGTYRSRSEIFRFLALLPKLTNGTYGSRLIDVLTSDDRAAALYRAFGERNGRSLDIDQLLLFTIRDGLVTEVLALPNDPPAFEAFWGASRYCSRSAACGDSSNSTSSRWIREPSISTTWRTSPSVVTSSPTSGARPSSPKT